MVKTVRQATANDRDFLIDAIIEAEKSGSDIISYCSIFSITEEKLRETLSDIFDEEMEDQELHIPNFLIAEVDGQPAATLSGWIEKKNGITSNIIKSNLLMCTLDRDLLLNAAPALKLMHQVDIPRSEGTLQLECGHTRQQFRGMGLAALLVEAHVQRQKDNGETMKIAQIITMKGNPESLRAYHKAGFSITAEKTCSDDGILKLLPGKTKLLIEKKIN